MKINGLPVVDAPKPLKLHITKSDVAKGNTKDPGACAAARACMRELHAEEARVHIGRTYLKMGGKWMRFNTGPALRSEIIAFDRGGTFEPGEYHLAALYPSERPTGKRRGGQSPNKTRAERRVSPKRRKPHTVTGIRAHGANR